MREIEITQREAGQRLDRFLSKYMPQASSGFLHKMLRKKNIKRNQTRADGSEKLEAGDRIQIYFSEETLDKFCAAGSGSGRTVADRNKADRNMADRAGEAADRRTGPGPAGNRRSGPAASGRKIQADPARKEVRLLYQDEDILAFHKPAGMLTQKAAPGDDSLNDYLIDYCLDQGILTGESLRTFHPSVANRLDRNTSGIVLCGISVRGLQKLSLLLRSRDLGKYYICPVEGQMKKEGRLTGYMVKDRKSNRVTFSREKGMGKDLKGSAVETEFRVLAGCSRASLLEVHLITGKSHQIRSHLAAMGHPVFGDYKYGDRAFNDRLKRKYGLDHQLLHCCRVSIPGGPQICDPLPEKMERIIRDFGLTAPQEKKESR